MEEIHCVTFQSQLVMTTLMPHMHSSWWTRKRRFSKSSTCGCLRSSNCHSASASACPGVVGKSSSVWHNSDVASCGHFKKLVAEEMFLEYDPMSLYDLPAKNLENVNGTMRDDAMLNLWCLHRAFYNLSPDTFARAVIIVDKVLTRVRVKPKYMAVLATSAYYLAAKVHETDANVPTRKQLVGLTRCGGTAHDLQLMTDIIVKKLAGDFNGSSPIDFVKYFLTQMPQQFASLLSHETAEEIAWRMCNRLLLGMTSLCMYRYRMLTLALAAILMEVENNPNVTAVSNLMHLAMQCSVDEEAILSCVDYLQFFRPANMPLWKHPMSWPVSKKTKQSMLQRKRSSSVSLEAIYEEKEEELGTVEP